MSNTIAKMYRKAAARLEHGWIQHAWFNDQGECLVQAMGRATGLTKEGNITRKLPLCQVEPLVKELGLQPTAWTRAGLTKALWEWNDEEDRQGGEEARRSAHLGCLINNGAVRVYMTFR